jgi:hypothetical protein
MHLTRGSVAALMEGAECDCLDTNAISASGDNEKYYACQFIWEEEQYRHLRQPFPEYKPVLEVEHIHWLGTRGGIPVIRLVVTDGAQSMEMRPSLRSDYVKRRNFKKSGHLFRGKLNVGKRFTLLEYTTDVVDSVPTIFYEDIRAEPQKKCMKSLSRAHAIKMNQGEETRRPNSGDLSLDEALKQMEGQLQRLKIHRARLGY